MADRFTDSVVTLTASALDTWSTCRRRYLLGTVLKLEPSDDGPDFVAAGRVHAMLEQIHRDGSCRDDEHVRTVLTGYGLQDDPGLAGYVERHRVRCPTSDRSWHEVEVARHRRASPSFIVTGRLDAVWVHHDLLEVRDYKTGRPPTDRVADDERARLQAWLVAPRAAELGLRLRIRYEYLDVAVAEDPEPYEPDADDLAGIEAYLARTVQDLRSEREWPGTPMVTHCQRCEYRSVCSVSLAPGTPRWEHTDPRDDPAGSGGGARPGPG